LQITLIMKTSIKYLAVLFIGLYSFKSYSVQLPKVKNDNQVKLSNFAFTYGEKLQYRMHYGPFNAGYATLEIQNEPVLVNGRRTFNIKASAKSSGSIDFLYNKVRNDYETYMDEEYLVPLKYTKKVEEGKYRDSDFALFDRDANKINAKKASIDNVSNQVQDLLSVYYWTRVWDVKNAKVGDTYPTVFYMDGKVYNYAIKYLGKEVVKIDAGKFNAIKIRPQVKTGDFFKNEDALTIWVSDDDNHIVLKVESEIFVGAVAMTLTDYKNLKNPTTSKIK
jgi:hypothetical protein